MPFQNVFKRYEFKYLITKSQKERILKEISPFMTLDKYGHSKISNVYFDTDTYLLIRRSIEKPVYKEKLRIRKYSSSDKVFVELKKKYKHVVYKRRLSLNEDDAFAWLVDKSFTPPQSQITNEIDHFCNYYITLHPTLFLSYEREAFYSDNHPAFRLTFDENILCRENELNFTSNAPQTHVLSDDNVLMEIKCTGGIPLFMTNILSRNKIYKTSFSKYGTAYKNIILPKLLSKEKL